jgi:hypothetical protein
MQTFKERWGIALVLFIVLATVFGFLEFRENKHRNAE